MRRDKATARILLILSVVHATVAAPAIVRQRPLDIVNDVTPVSEKRGVSDEESSGSFPQSGPQMGNDLSRTSGTAPSQDDVQPTSEIPPQDNPLRESGTLELHNEPPGTSGAPPAPDDMPPGSGIPGSQNDVPPTSGSSSLQDDRPAASGLPPSHNDEASKSRTAPLQDDMPLASGTLPSHNELPPTSGAPLLQDDRLSVSGDPELPKVPQGGSEDPQLHDDLMSQHTGESSRTSSTASGALQLQNYLPPASETPQVHDDDTWRLHYNFHANDGTSSSSDFDSEALFPTAAPPQAPEAHTVFNDALKQKLKIFGDYGLVAGVSAALTLLVHKMIKSNGSYVSVSFPPSLTDI